MKFVDIFNDIGILAKQDDATNDLLPGIAGNLCKATEELGELAQEINKLFGKKTWKPGDTEEIITANILEEGSDLIQCVISILDARGITAEQLKTTLEKKNKKYKTVLTARASKQV
ncbi:MAG: hypothetical protein ABIP51_11175 [Bacteroidia bacterium]